METLAEDLLLLAVRPNGKLGAAPKLRFGLSGSELVRLAAARRVDIVRGRIVVLDAAPTGDDLLDAALQSMTGGRRQPTAKAWVARSRPGLVDRYLDRLAAAGVIRAESRQIMGLFPGTRWVVVDTARQAQVRARLDAIASGSVAPGSLDSEQAAFAGLAGAIGLSALIYPGFAGAGARKNLKKAATRERSESPAADAVADAAAATGAAAHAADHARDAAMRAAMNASVQAATDAAVAASIDAATQAAISASADAAAHHGGAAGGHH
jgi:Golgi phosphoprotein 3 (GPP34)